MLAIHSLRSSARVAAFWLLVAATALALWPSAARAATTLAVTPLTDTNPVGTTHTLTATVSPATAGQLVRFSISTGPNLGDSGVVATNSSGVAVISYVGDGGEGTDAIFIWVDLDADGVLDGGEPVQIATKTWTAISSHVVSLTPESDTNPVGTSHTLTATVDPAQSGVVVDFAVLSGPNTGDHFEGTTSSNGVATGSYVGDGGAGVDVIIAWVDLDGDNAQDSNEAGLAAVKTWTSTGGSSTLTLTPTTDTNPVGTSHTLTATLAPAQNNVRVRFRVLSGPNSGVTRSDRTNSSGVAQDSYTGTGGAGIDTILAWADFDDDGNQDSDEPAAIATKIWTVSGPVTAIALSPSSDTNPVGTTHTLTATVTPKLSGVHVRFEVLSGPNAGKKDADTTNSSGVATGAYTGTGGAGTDTIIAWADLDNDANRDSGEPSAVVTKTWTGVGPVTTISLSPASDTNDVGDSHRLTATVSPKQSGITVRFEVVSGPHRGVTRTDTTNSSGVATANYTGTTTGVDTVIAWADLDRDGRRDSGEPSAVATKTWESSVLGTVLVGNVPTSGFGLIVWGGGSTNLLVSASGCSGFSTLRFWATSTLGGVGKFVVYIPASNVARVNEPWFDLFPGGLLPANTALLATCGR